MYEYSGSTRAIDVARAPKLPRTALRLLKSSNSVLDVGCGTGFLSKALSNTQKYEGVTYSEKEVDNLKKQGLSAACVDLDNEPLPYETESFDCVFASNILEHFEKRELQNVMNEMRRVLKRGGVLIVATPTDYHPFFYGEWSHVRPYNHSSLPQLLKDFEFEQVEWCYRLLEFLPRRLQALLRIPFFFLKPFIWKEIFCWGKKPKSF
ncbi:class I SAM-dependent methyltransferase [Candidatus Woesearchaeota archaeon]|nr:class I SAM-dependent methyltransferase [Candidatus Woesearchaeota archaeon]